MKKNLSGCIAILVLLGLLALCTGNLFAQATDSVLVGTVTDSSGAAVPAANITAANKDTGVKYTAATNATGDYRLNNIPVGTYNVTAAKTGFTSATMADVQLQLNHTSSVNLTLEVGTVSTTVEVAEAAALIDTSTAQLQSTFDSKIAVDSPLAGLSKVVNGAGIYNLSLLGAGVASSGGVGQGTGPSIAGQRPEANAFNIDGVMNDAHVSTGPQITVSNEAVAQFNLVQNQFSAEFGSASGGVFNAIVKTGTNQIHGSAYEYMQNRNLNAVDYSLVVAGNRSNPRYDNNRFGGTFGGPIKKDKLFYFGSIEYNPLGQSSVPGSPVDAPTQAGISALNGMSGLSKNNLSVFEKYVPVATSVDPSNPYTTVNGVNIPLGALTFASPNYDNSMNIVGSIDWNVSDKDQVRGRYFYNRIRGLDNAAALPVFYQSSPTTNNSVSISEFHNFSGTMENELRISYLRNNAETSAGNYQFPGLSVFPNISLDDLNLQIGPDPNTPAGQIENDAQLQENLTKTWGRHTFKAGVNIADIVSAGFFVQRVRGDYDYASLQEFLLDQQPSGSAFGTPNSGERNAGTSGGIPIGYLQYAGYFNDDYRVRPNLTLNLGIRYEYVTVPVSSRYQADNAAASVPGVITFASPKSNGNEWSPRLGFAYSPGSNGKWSIRGGVARSFYNYYGNLSENGAPPFFATTVDVNPDHPVSNFLANGGLTPSLAGAAPTPAQLRAATATYTFDQTRPYALTGTLGVQRSFGHDYTLEARYVYTKGVHLWNQTRLNVISRVNPSHYIPTYFSMPSSSTLASDALTLGALKAILAPGTTSAYPTNDLAVYGFPNAIVGYHPWGNSRYDGLAVQMNKRYSQNFSYILAYTWSHAFDDSTATNFSTILSPRRAQDFQNMRAEWASSALDRRQRLTFSPTYDFRPFQNRTWLMKNIVGNWSTSFTYTFQSPEFATVQSGVDSNLNGDSLDRGIINPAGTANVGTGVTAYNAAGQQVAVGDASTVAYVANNANARYVVAQSGALSNSGRNTLPLAHTNNFDFSLMKRVNITEAKRFEIGAQLYNLFNHSQFVGGYLSDVSSYGTAAISRNFLVPNNTLFGAYQQFFPSNSRQMQLVARFTF